MRAQRVTDESTSPVLRGVDELRNVALAHKASGRRIIACCGLLLPVALLWLISRSLSWRPQQWEVGGHVIALAFSPAEPILACSVLRERAGGNVTSELQLWNIQPKRRVWSRTLGEGGDTLAFSPDGKSLASAYFDVEVWDVPSGKRLRALHGRHAIGALQSTALLFAPNSQTLFFSESDAVLQVFDVNAGRVTRTVSIAAEAYALSSPQPISEDAAFRQGYRTYASVYVSPDGKTLASDVSIWAAGGVPLGAFSVAPVGAEVWLRDAKGRVIHELKKAGGIIAFSPDSKLLFTCPNTKNALNIQVWNVRTGKLTRTLSLPAPKLGASRVIESGSPSQDGELFAAIITDERHPAELHIQVWNMDTGQWMRTVKPPHPPNVSGGLIAWSYDSSTLVYANDTYASVEERTRPSPVQTWRIR